MLSEGKLKVAPFRTNFSKNEVMAAQLFGLRKMPCSTPFFSRPIILRITFSSKMCLSHTNVPGTKERSDELNCLNSPCLQAKKTPNTSWYFTKGFLTVGKKASEAK